MTNPHRNEVEIKLHETTYKLRATFEAIAEMEEYMDCSLGELLLKMPYGKLRLKELKGIIMYGCHGAKFKVTEEQIEDDLVNTGISDATQAIAPFLAMAFKGVPKTTPVEKKEQLTLPM